MAWSLHNAGHRVFLVDRGEPATSSRIAAGLITPITGKHLVRSGEFDRLWNNAHHFYRSVEATLNRRLLHEAPSVRIIEEKRQAELFARPDLVDVP